MVNDGVHCPSGKTAYETKAVARSVTARSVRSSGKTLAIYRCPYCKRWHMSKRTDLPSSILVTGPRSER